MQDLQASFAKSENSRLTFEKLTESKFESLEEDFYDRYVNLRARIDGEEYLSTLEKNYQDLQEKFSS